MSKSPSAAAQSDDTRAHCTCSGLNEQLVETQKFGCLRSMTYWSGPLAVSIQLQESSPLAMMKSKGRAFPVESTGTSAVRYALS